MDFLEKLNLIKIMIAKEDERKNAKSSPHFTPFLQNLGLLIEEKSMSNDQLYNYIMEKEGWEAYNSKVRAERQSTEPRNPHDMDNSSSDGYGSSAVSMEDEEVSDEPNDADDYDTEQAEILLSKAEIEVVDWSSRRLIGS